MTEKTAARMSELLVLAVHWHSSFTLTCTDN